MPMKVLYLHGTQNPRTSKKIRGWLYELFASADIACPNLHSKKATVAFIFLMFALVSTFFGVSISVLALCEAHTAIPVTFVMILVLVLGSYAANSFINNLVLKNAVKAAEQAFAKHSPNLIVATNFGSVVATMMDIPKLPMVLISPTICQHSRFMGTKTSRSLLAEYPYAIIVHGSHDTQVILDDSIELIATGLAGSCRLEVIDDDGGLSTLEVADMKRWCDEAFEQGRQKVIQMGKEGAKGVDPKLFMDDVAYSDRVRTID